MRGEWAQKAREGLPTDADSYAVYLTGDLWLEIRARVNDRDGGLCRTCGCPARVVHHRSYGIATMRGEDDSELFSLCHKCHEFVHFTPSGEKRTGSESRETLDLLLTP